MDPATATAAAATQAVFSAANTSMAVMNQEYNITCLILIENDTPWKMTNPCLEIHNGSVPQPPAVIKARNGGVIKAHKTAFSVMGCGATMTWNVGDLGCKIEVNFGIAGGGVSWANSNHLQLRILDRYGKESSKQYKKFYSGKVCQPVSVSCNKFSIEGTMGNTDHSVVNITISEI